MLQYHDREWGVPVHDDRKHFEFLMLEAAGRTELVDRAEKAGRLPAFFQRGGTKTLI
jgi:Methyladenine glycosylase